MFVEESYVRTLLSRVLPGKSHGQRDPASLNALEKSTELSKNVALMEKDLADGPTTKTGRSPGYCDIFRRSKVMQHLQDFLCLVRLLEALPHKTYTD